MMRYLLDANVFIQVRILRYGFDCCSAFRKWLAQRNRTGSTASTERVADEPGAGNDNLADVLPTVSKMPRHERERFAQVPVEGPA